VQHFILQYLLEIFYTLQTAICRKSPYPFAGIRGAAAGISPCLIRPNACSNKERTGRFNELNSSSIYTALPCGLDFSRYFASSFIGVSLKVGGSSTRVLRNAGPADRRIHGLGSN
jgi:hypothetical protein